MAERRRVVITGMGAVSGAGIGWKPLWNAAREGASVIRQLEFARDYPGRIRLGELGTGRMLDLDDVDEHADGAAAPSLVTAAVTHGDHVVLIREE